MHLRQIWIALSPSRQTVMYSPGAPCLILPPASEAVDGAVTLALGSQESADAQVSWLAITHVDMRCAG